MIANNLLPGSDPIMTPVTHAVLQCPADTCLPQDCNLGRDRVIVGSMGQLSFDSYEQLEVRVCL